LSEKPNMPNDEAGRGYITWTVTRKGSWKKKRSQKTHPFVLKATEG
jgi:hypothetical protein